MDPSHGKFHMEALKGNEAGGKDGESESLAGRLLASRTIVLSGGVDAELAQKVIQQLVLLDHADPKAGITMIINSPGGEVFSGFAIFDVMLFISAPVCTVVSGLAASMGSIIALAPDPERRFALPNSKFLIHQPLMTGYQGRATDLEIQAKEILRDRDRIIALYAEKTKRKAEEIGRDIDRDNWMSVEEALEYGLVGKIIKQREEIPD